MNQKRLKNTGLIAFSDIFDIKMISLRISVQQTSFKLSQMEIFNPETKMWTLLNQPIPVLSNHVSEKIDIIIFVYNRGSEPCSVP